MCKWPRIGSFRRWCAGSCQYHVLGTHQSTNLGIGPAAGVKSSAVLTSERLFTTVDITVNAKKLETGLRTTRAGIPYTSLL